MEQNFLNNFILQDTYRTILNQVLITVKVGKKSFFPLNALTRLELTSQSI